MPARGFPIDIDAIILFELARGMGSGPELLRRVRGRMQARAYRLNYGSWYPALKRLETKGFVIGGKPPRPKGRRIPKIYALTDVGRKEARDLSIDIRALLLPLKAFA
jgi:DNA-binding PadR family transcriptional regulator